MVLLAAELPILSDQLEAFDAERLQADVRSTQSQASLLRLILKQKLTDVNAQLSAWPEFEKEADRVVREYLQVMVMMQNGDSRRNWTPDDWLLWLQGVRKLAFINS